MSIVEPFKATYYNIDKVKDLSRVVCPPYDVINKEQEKKLKKKSVYNYAHMTLKDTKFSYKDISKVFDTWFDKKALITDEENAFYLLEQTFKVAGKQFKRRGLMGALKLSGRHSICAHEKTHEGPKADRMNMLKYMKANLSPNFIIYPKKKGEPTAAMMKKFGRKRPFMAVNDDNEKVKYKIWKIADPKDILKIKEYFKDIDLMIADGHHRTEVATTFYKTQKKNDKKYNYMMSYLSPVDNNLAVFPTHRVLTRKLDIEKVLESAKELFSVKKFKNIKEMAEAVAKKRKFAFAFAQDKQYYAFTLKDVESLDKIFKTKKEKAYKAIDSFLLHHLVFEKVLDVKTKEGDLVYTIDPKEAEVLAKENEGCVFLLKSTSVEEVMKVSVSGLTMPQKTTYFFPKLLSGLMLRKHDEQ